MLPPWLELEYRSAWREVEELALHDVAATSDALVFRSALSVIALAKGERKLGGLLAWLDESAIDELAEEHLDWSQLPG